MLVPDHFPPPAEYPKPLEQEINTIYRDIIERIRAAATLTRVLEGQSARCEAIYTTYYAECTEHKGKKDILEKVASTAKMALLDIEWELDKRLTINQLQIMYVSILQFVNLSPEDDLEDLNPEQEGITEISLALAKQAKGILDIAIINIDEALDKGRLTNAAMDAQIQLVQVRSSLVKEKTFYQLETLVEQILKQEENFSEKGLEISKILGETRALLFLEDENEIITPEKATKIIVEFSKRLSALEK